VRQLGEAQRRHRRELGGLEHDGVPGRERRRDLPREHQQREVPRDDLPDDAQRPVARELRVHELRPPGVVVEVPRRERHVEVAGLPDRLAVVERLEHREQARVLLHGAGERVEVPGAPVTAQRRPAGLRGARGPHRAVDVVGRALRHAREHGAGGRVVHVEQLGALRAVPVAADVVRALAPALLQPAAGLGVALGGRAVGERLEQLGDGGRARRGAPGRDGGRHQTMGWRWAAE
jgi:ParB family chromosome partitioning protein